MPVFNQLVFEYFFLIDETNQLNKKVVFVLYTIFTFFANLLEISDYLFKGLFFCEKIIFGSWLSSLLSCYLFSIIGNNLSDAFDGVVVDIAIKFMGLNAYVSSKVKKLLETMSHLLFDIDKLVDLCRLFFLAQFCGLLMELFMDFCIFLKVAYQILFKVLLIVSFVFKLSTNIFYDYFVACDSLL